jgi:hypothetical protein
MEGCCQSLDIDGWIRACTPFENGVADVTGCSQIGVVLFFGVGIGNGRCRGGCDDIIFMEANL